MTVTDAINLAISGLGAGAIYALLAVSYNIIFATTGILNLPQGDLMMIGAMVAAGIAAGARWPIIAGFFITIVAGSLVGALEERFAVRPATRHGHNALSWAVSTIGVSVILQAAFTLAVGGDVQGVPALISGRPVWDTSILIIPDNVLLIGSSIVVGLAVAAFYAKTYVGKALGAVAQDRDGAVLRGVPVSRFATLSFALGGAVAAFTGFVAGPLTQALPTMGITFALKGFIAAAVGGIPDIRGALIGGWLLGIVESFVGYAVGAAYQVPVVFGILLVVLASRPHGLLGNSKVREV